MKAIDYKASFILDSLNFRFPRENVKYKISNSYIFRHDWESDFFLITKSGYAHEIEIKISRSDFFADAKKTDKHQILKTGLYEHKRNRWNSETNKFEVAEIEVKPCERRPHKFFYCVPVDLIEKSEVPEYAGLMYVDELGQVTTIKEAPYIHKSNLDLSGTLANKFYNKYMDSRNELSGTKRDNERLRNLLKQNNIRP